MSEFKKAFEYLIKNEGKKVFEDVEGGEYSKFGITLSTYRYLVDLLATNEVITNMTLGGALDFYLVHWWDKWKFGMIDDQLLATKVFDFSVNTYPTTAMRLLQKAVNSWRAAVTKEGPIPEDGLMGPKTASAVNSIPAHSLMPRFVEMMEQHYDLIVQRNPKKAKYLAGWKVRARRMPR